MKSSPVRYIIYLLIGVALYFVLYENEAQYQTFRSKLPYLLIGVVILMLFVRFIRGKQGE
ncbi:MAG: hypothetical protein JXQ90_02300 [Cyclobacteriaceae bacterium]